MLIFLISVPVHNAVLYYFSFPKLFLFTSTVRFFVVLLLGWYMIGVYGAMGAAISVLAGSVLDLAIPGIWVFNKHMEIVGPSI